jgi:hypothetical protein
MQLILAAALLILLFWATTCELASWDVCWLSLGRQTATDSAALLSCILAGIAAMGAEPAAAAGATAAAAGSSRQPAGAAACVKREAGVARVKRERDVGGDGQGDDDFVVPRSATAAVDVDLTEEASGEGGGLCFSSGHYGSGDLRRKRLTSASWD